MRGLSTHHNTQPPTLLLCWHKNQLFFTRHGACASNAMFTPNLFGSGRKQACLFKNKKQIKNLPWATRLIPGAQSKLYEAVFLAHPCTSPGVSRGAPSTRGVSQGQGQGQGQVSLSLGFYAIQSLRNLPGHDRENPTPMLPIRGEGPMVRQGVGHGMCPQPLPCTGPGQAQGMVIHPVYLTWPGVTLHRPQAPGKSQGGLRPQHGKKKWARAFLGTHGPRALSKDSLANAGDSGYVYEGGAQVTRQLASPWPRPAAHKAWCLLVLASTWGQSRFHCYPGG